MEKYQGLLFDLDGVLVDTAKYHFIAWKALADSLGIPFTEEVNERLKGVSRMRSFEIILEVGGRTLSEAEKEVMCSRKNDLYVEYIKKLRQDEVFPGVRDFFTDARAQGYKTALGSASKNSRLILDRLGIENLFDAIVDGTKVSRAKPDPEVFLKGAEALGLPNGSCIVFEDAFAGIEAAHNAGMAAVGIGTYQHLPNADTVISGFFGMHIEDVLARLG